MSVHPISSAPNPAADQLTQAALYRLILHDLIDTGGELARQIHRRAMTQPARPSEFVTAFELASRAVRCSIMLAQKIAQPMHTPLSSDHAATGRRRIIRAIEDAIRTPAAKPLDSAAADKKIVNHRPTVEIIADICRDLGRVVQAGSYPWKDGTPPDIAELCVRAAFPRSATPAGNVTEIKRRPIGEGDQA